MISSKRSIEELEQEARLKNLVKRKKSKSHIRIVGDISNNDDFINDDEIDLVSTKTANNELQNILPRFSRGKALQNEAVINTELETTSYRNGIITTAMMKQGWICDGYSIYGNCACCGKYRKSMTKYFVDAYNNYYPLGGDCAVNMEKMCRNLQLKCSQYGILSE